MFGLKLPKMVRMGHSSNIIPLVPTTPLKIKEIIKWLTNIYKNIFV